MVTLFIGCDLFNNEQAKLPGELVPLAVGNYWDYHRWYLSPNIADTIREEIKSEHTFVVDGVEQKMYGYQQFYLQQPKRATSGSSLLAFLENKQSSAPFRYKNDVSTPDYQWLRANGEDGLLSFGGISPSDTLLLRSMQYRYPTKAGEQQEFPTLSYSFSKLQFSVQDTITIETIGTNETFESEWATYKGCYVYRFQEVGKEDAVYIWDHYVYIKPGIGIVAVDTRQHYSGGEDPEDLTIGQWILIDHQLND
tara:strand:- start:3097 stop:3852 length:756 start_codon:yes stop_codon:yes gene_type:complete